jgi:hypothetical protein
MAFTPFSGLLPSLILPLFLEHGIYFLKHGGVEVGRPRGSSGAPTKVLLGQSAGLCVLACGVLNTCTTSHKVGSGVLSVTTHAN